MKKLLVISIAVCFCIGLFACSSRVGRENNYESDFDAGYREGYYEGLRDGAFSAQEDIAEEVWDRYHEAEGQTTQERGLHPEEAIIELNDYLKGKDVSESELRTAIRAITYFYYEAWDVINEIDDMDIDFNFCQINTLKNCFNC